MTTRLDEAERYVALRDYPPPARADLQELQAWVRAEPGRESRLSWNGSRWWVELFNRTTCVASVGHADPTVALARALEQAKEAAT